MLGVHVFGGSGYAHAHSKWLEGLTTTYATFGLPDQIVTNNGPQFVSDEFDTFMRSNSAKEVHS